MVLDSQSPSCSSPWAVYWSLWSILMVLHQVPFMLSKEVNIVTIALSISWGENQIRTDLVLRLPNKQWK